MEKKKGMYFEDFVIGEEHVSPARTVTETDIQQFAGLSGDYNPLHTDEEFAKANTPFGHRIGHGALTFAIGTGLAFRQGLTSDTAIAFLGTELAFKNPVFAGDTIHLVNKCIDKKETSKPERGIITMQGDMVNQRGEVVMVQKNTVMIMRKPVQ